MGREKPYISAMTTISQDPAPLFTQPDGSYQFARWGRPLAPVVFGVGDESLTYLKDGIAQTVAITGGVLAETDPELGSNFMWFFCRDWAELREVPNLDKLFPDFEGMLAALEAQGATRYRWFGFDDQGAISLCVVLIRVDAATEALSIQTLATAETFQSLLTFSEAAFAQTSPLATIKSNGICIVKPEYAAVVRAAYDPSMPAVSDDPAHALRLGARAGLLVADLDDDP